MKDSADIRKVNLYKIRSMLWKGQWKTKQQIALETGLSVATCNTLLNDLAHTGEVVSEKVRLHDVGPGALQYRINEVYESILCVWFERSKGQDVLVQYVLAPTGKILFQERSVQEALTPSLLQEEIEKRMNAFPNISSIMIGTPSVAEAGVICHCDIPALNNYSILSDLAQKYTVPVYLENDMHFKAFGYAKMHGTGAGVVTVTNFPRHVLPGAATAHDGMVIKGQNQFAGMVGFLPYEVDRETLLEQLKPDTCRPYVSKAIVSLISVLNPEVIVLSGEILDESCPQWVYEDCLRWIPKDYMPELIYLEDLDACFLEGMYRKALEQKGVF